MLVAAFATRGLSADVLRTVLAEHDLVIGEIILAEFRRVLASKFHVTTDRIDAAVAVLSSVPIIPKPQEPSPLPVRDSTDRWILATAIDGAADVLVTGDHDLLAIAGDAPMPILEPRAFWALLRKTAR